MTAGYNNVTCKKSAFVKPVPPTLLRSAALLDELSPNIPVVLARMDMHTWWVNSVVLKLAGISQETPDPS
jgi:predicted amidohydrolase YtcJ